ncbi:MAG: DUF362 domain-containing protein [Sedimentisphaerales bacterium]|nr:DUF362 domain-containing protein [Sedimentisphaerales bacterium]
MAEKEKPAFGRDEKAQPRDGHGWFKGLWAIVGLFSLIWFLIRVLPKPSRATYPCQRMAFPLASSFIIWLFGLTGSAAAMHKARRHLARSRYIAFSLAVLIGVGCIWMSLALTADKDAVAATPHPVNSPIGTPQGIHPGRVIWVHDPNATNWTGPGMGDGYWWQSTHSDQAVIDEMVHNAICGLAGKIDINQAWDAMIRYFNIQHGKGDIGYQPGEKIMIKVNFVDMIAVWGNTNYSFTGFGRHPEYAICSPQIMHALLEQLVNVVGVAQEDITIGDPICLWCNEFYDMLHPDFPDVRYLDYLGYYGRTKFQFDTNTPFYWSNGGGAGKTQDYVLKSYSEAAYFINLASLKGHYNHAGITVCGKNHFGSLRRPDASGYFNMHADCAFDTPVEGSYRSLVDLMGHEDIGGKTLLYMIDGLYGGKHALAYPQNLPRKWQTAPFNNDWPSSIFVSQDPVAIDSVAFDFLITEWPDANGPAHIATDDYLHEAALADAPPSGTFYDPEDDGVGLASLGVHEHWNNAADKQYSGNLGFPGGIELLKVTSIPNPDISGNGRVDLEDLAIIAQNWQQSGTPGDIAPIPVPDGIVDQQDLAFLCEYWLMGATP